MSPICVEFLFISSVLVQWDGEIFQVLGIRFFVSICCCCFFLYEGYDIIFPLITVFPVSLSSEGVVSAELFVSRRSAHSCLIKVVKLGSSKY